jgi:uncharacterized protein
VHPDTPAPLAPIETRHRLAWIDALRSFALLGILLSNIHPLSGYAFMDDAARARLPLANLAPAIDWFTHVFVEGKFYALFSLLFGMGFALQLARAPQGFAPVAAMHRRRMGWLLLFGLVHAWLLWWGDILVIYALLGFTLPWFLRRSATTLLVSGIGFLLLPIAVYLIYLAIGMPDPFAPAATTATSGPSLAARLTAAFANGSYLDTVKSNVIMNAGGWIRRLMRFQLPRILGMFLIGASLVRAGIVQRPTEHKALLERLLLAGFVLGLPLNVAYTALGSGDALLPATAMGLVAVALASPAIPLLSLGYFAAFALLWRSKNNESIWTASGRLPLTNYLMQSVIGMALFYAYGLGLWQKLGDAQLLFVAIAIVVAQALFSRLWLRRHSMGPMESLWRRLSYGKPSRLPSHDVFSG